MLWGVERGERKGDGGRRRREGEEGGGFALLVMARAGSSMKAVVSFGTACGRTSLSSSSSCGTLMKHEPILAGLTLPERESLFARRTNVD